MTTFRGYSSSRSTFGGAAKKTLLATSSLICLPAIAQAQDGADAIDETDDVIIVTGSNIRGARINEALPVTVLGVDDIAAVGAIDGDDLIRSLPSQGSTNFRNDNIGTVNSARGDIGSINLRSIGSSGTLVLLNGRRVVNTLVRRQSCQHR